MDLVKAVQNYLSKITSDVSGMKVLLVDKETTPIISVVYTQTQLLQKEIYLVDRIENRQREKMKHLKCIAFLRPNQLSIQHLTEELRDPCFGDYHIYFTNTVQKSSIERLAESDVHEVIREVQEYFADFVSVNNNLFSLNVNYPDYSLFIESPKAWDPNTLTRVTEGVVSVLLALKKKPLIRFENNSALARKLAAEVTYSIQNEGPLFDFRKPDTPPILLILDRRNDPITPLLNQWTYQAMIHEMLGITNGRVDLSSVKDIRPEMKEIVLSADQDEFYKQNQYLNLGDLGSNIKSYVDEFQNKHHSTSKIESINDMKRFVEDYPEFRKLSGNVSKHVTLVGELSKRIASSRLLEVGELEQSLAVANNHSADSKLVQQFLTDPNISVTQKMRLFILYALRYEKTPSNLISLFVKSLESQGIPGRSILAVEEVLKYAGADVRMEPILQGDDLLGITKNVFKGLKGVENVYTQHTPRLVTVIQDAIKGKLKDTNYPFYEGSTKDKPQDIIVFVIGGATYAEALHISQLNFSNPNVRIILGGTTIHNSTSFLKEVSESVSKFTNDGKDTTPLQTSNRDVQRTAPF
ncbi:Sec1-like protein [Globomyces pollinis-pini]|nr:Sec1-like protein [Globomyces pollinis-pini]